MRLAFVTADPKAEFIFKFVCSLFILPASSPLTEITGGRLMGCGLVFKKGLINALEAVKFFMLKL